MQTVSATLGQDSLRAGLVAGLIGLALVAIYMLLYYRALGLVVMLGLAVWSALMYSIIAWLGDDQGLALTLAGVTGIIVSVGVTVDSYVVYFERLKDEVRSGKTIRSSVDRGFQRAFRTILTADIVVAHRRRPALLAHRRPGARASPSSSACRRSSTWSSPTSSPGRWWRCSAAAGFFTEARFFGVARGLGRSRPGREVAHDRDRGASAQMRSIWSPALPRRDRLRLRRPVEAVVRHLRRRDPHRPASPCSPGASTSASTSRAATSWEVPGRRPSRRRGPRRARRRSGSTRPRSRSLGDDDGVRLRIQTESADDARASASSRDRRRRSPSSAGVDVDRGERQPTVGPSWGEEITEKALRALVFFLVADHLYITLRFEWKMAMATLAALVHDILVTSASTRSSGFEVTPATVIAILTILGFSLYDGIVVFDKVDENTRARVVDRPHDLHRHGEPVAEPGADAVAQHVDHRAAADAARCWSSARSSSAPPRSQDFALALLIGQLSGAYSSIFIASPGPRPAEGARAALQATLRRAARGRAGAAAARPSTAGGPARPTRRRRRRRSTARDDGRRAGGRPPRPGPARRAPAPTRPITRRGPAKKTQAAVSATVARPGWRRSSATSPTSRSPGIVFKDITPLLADAAAFRPPSTASPTTSTAPAVDQVLGIEARGFILAAPVAYRLGAGFVPVRKAGQAAVATVEREEYELEYGTDLLEIHRDAVEPGERVLIVDDVLATGGTAAGRRAGWSSGSAARWSGFAFLIELAFLDGRAELRGPRRPLADHVRLT